MTDDRITVHAGDCLDVLRTMADSSIDSCVTDPPYHLTNNTGTRSPYPGQYTPIGKPKEPKGGFMGKKWDGGDIAFQPELWAEVLRVLKPGGHLLAFGGSRTYHRLACAVEDAGFEIRDQIMWVFGSGFPKSHDVSKGIDKAGPPGQAPYAEFAKHYEEHRKARGLSHAQVCAAGGWHGSVNHGGSSVNWANGYGMPTPEQWVILQPLLDLDERWSERVQRIEYEREVTGANEEWIDRTNYAITSKDGLRRDKPASPEAIRWSGWGTALKPAHEPIVLARKPLSEPTVAANVLRWGTGAINVDGCRVQTSKADAQAMERCNTPGSGRHLLVKQTGVYGRYEGGAGNLDTHKGRWPANLIHDGSDEVLAAFPESKDGVAVNRNRAPGISNKIYGKGWDHNGRDKDTVEVALPPGSLSRLSRTRTR
jgi:hypothetical protein